MFEQEQRKLLNDASARFPEGCLCEDCGECAYCRFIMNQLSDRSTHSTVGFKKSLRYVLIEKAQFGIPIGEAEQICELRKMFRHSF